MPHERNLFMSERTPNILPAVFHEVSYFDDEYRGELIVTEGCLYYIPVKKTGYDKVYVLGGVPDRVINFVLKFILISVMGIGVGELYGSARRAWRFVRRGQIQENLPQTKVRSFWNTSLSNDALQWQLDGYIRKKRAGKLMRPQRFCLDQISNPKFEWRFTFTTEYDQHDFGISPFHRSAFRQTLIAGGFLR